MVISRSGYTTLMDLSNTSHKAILCPTPGQYEQEYLAAHVQDKGFANYSEQSSFNLDKLKNFISKNGRLGS